ncbi:MAG: redoxin domain-containing protein [Armatimonadetes bacterium]|nr:redoxin domain-containing protein [Armatimonadota bacterium]
MGLLYGADYSNTIASIKLLPETRIGSRDVYALSIKFKDGTVAPRGTHISQTLWVGKSDMALYKTVTMLSAKPKPRTDIQGAPPKLLETTITTIVSKYEPNPTLPANTFAFKPPAGSKEINQQPEVLDLRGKQVPNFAFEWTTGEQKSLSDFKGRILLLDFISLPMCESQLPVLKKVNDNMGDRAQLIVVNVDRDEAQVRSYLKEKGYDSLPVVFLNESSAGVIGEGYRLVGLPIMYFVDENGVVRGQAMGVPSDKQIEEKLNEVMSR